MQKGLTQNRQSPFLSFFAHAKQFNWVDFELQHVGGLASIIAAFALHRDTADFQVPGSSDLNGAIAKKIGGNCGWADDPTRLKLIRLIAGFRLPRFLTPR